MHQLPHNYETLEHFSDPMDTCDLKSELNPQIPYSQLLAPTEIRLIRIKPCQPPNPAGILECTLEHVLRSKKTSYAALSYTWGDPKHLVPILVNDITVHVGTNLENALRTLRDHFGILTVWADQLCIHQANDAEKSQQVQQMKNIYADADLVVAWLGMAADDSDRLMMRLAQLGDAAGNLKALRKVRRVYAKKANLSSLAEAFDAFCKRAYWSRLWVLQEFAVAARVKVVCGSASMTAEQLESAIDYLTKLKDEIDKRVLRKMENRVGTVTIATIFKSTALELVVNVLKLRWDYHNNGGDEEVPDSDSDFDDAVDGRSFYQVLLYALTLMGNYNNPQCKDSRDRIFAVLGLAVDASKFGMFPDYSKSCEDIYEEVTRKFLQQGNIDVLACCQFPRATRDRALGTWAPDWSAPLLHPCAGYLWDNHFSASGKNFQEQSILFPNPRSISLEGIKLDYIEKTGDVWNPDWSSPLDPRTALRYLSQVRMFCTKSSRIDKSVKLAAAGQIAVRSEFCEAHSAFIEDWEDWEDPNDSNYLKDSDSEDSDGTSDSSFLSWTAWQDPEECELCVHCFKLVLKTLAEMKKTGNKPLITTIDEKYTDLYMSELKTLHTRRPFLSKSGYVGLAPADCAEGDVIVIFFGGKTPYTLRLRTEVDYTLVGETYVYGVMYGEAMEQRIETETFILY
ncbi:hypothetical protein N0V90_012700 [Kalmusia sp. IMI 367209]|nr:hypothetical protein N0V90_012700 [Kalmusia sp. IMI 367209]